MSLRLAFRQWPWCFALAFGLVGCGKTSAPEEPATAPAASNASTEPGAAQAEALVKDAVALIHKRQFNEAVEKLSQAIKVDSKCAEAFFQRAGVLADAGNDRLALNDYSAAIELNHKDVRYHNMRGLFLLTRRQFDAAIQDFDAAIQADPKYVQAYNNRGLVHLAMSNYSDAVGDFNQAVEIDPTYVDGFNNRGFAYYQAENNEKALADFNKTLELNPKYVNAFNNRAMLFMRVKKFREAARDFTAAIELDENNIKHFQNRQTAFRELGMHRQGEADAERVKWLLKLNELNAAVSRKPDEPQSYIQRASHLAKGGRTEVALANFEQAIKVAPSSVEGLNGRALHWFDQGEYARAVSDCNQALDLLKKSNQWNRQTLSIRADAFLKLGKFDEAIADFEATERLDSAVAEAYFGRAQLRQKRGDTNGARADFEVAQQIDPLIGQ